MVSAAYRLDEQIGFLLRRAHQRHTALFGERMLEGLTPTQFAVLARLLEAGPISQNQLGRETAMDAATIKGVVDRLVTRELVALASDPNDQRRHIVSLTAAGRRVAKRCIKVATEITEATLAPIDPVDRPALLAFLAKLAENGEG